MGKLKAVFFIDLVRLVSISGGLCARRIFVKKKRGDKQIEHGKLLAHRRMIKSEFHELPYTINNFKRMKLKAKIITALLLLPLFLLAQNVVSKKTLHRMYTLSEGNRNYTTERIDLNPDSQNFALECLFVDHVNTPVGFELKAGKTSFLKVFNDNVQIGNIKRPITNGIQKYYHHFMVNIQNNQISVFNNGKQLISTNFNDTSALLELKMLAPFEKYIQLNDLIKEYVIYDAPLSQKIINDNLKTYTEALQNGTLPGNESQLIVQPFLSLPNKNRVNLCWESKLPSTGVIKYGTAYPLQHTIQMEEENDYGNTWEGPGDLGDLKVRQLVSLFDKYQVDFVTYGHLHCYERSYPLKNNQIDMENGTTYIIAGGAGGNIEDFAPHRTWFSAKTFRGYHYLIANIYKNSIRLDTYNSDGYLIDFYEKRKN